MPVKGHWEAPAHPALPAQSVGRPHRREKMGTHFLLKITLLLKKITKSKQQPLAFSWQKTCKGLWEPDHSLSLSPPCHNFMPETLNPKIFSILHYCYIKLHHNHKCQNSQTYYIKSNSAKFSVVLSAWLLTVLVILFDLFGCCGYCDLLCRSLCRSLDTFVWFWSCLLNTVRKHPALCLTLANWTTHHKAKCYRKQAQRAKVSSN